jgi:hypothetical protein
MSEAAEVWIICVLWSVLFILISAVGLMSTAQHSKSADGVQQKSRATHPEPPGA